MHRWQNIICCDRHPSHSNEKQHPQSGSNHQQHIVIWWSSWHNLQVNILFHIKTLRHFHNRINLVTPASIACSVVSSRLDYCNSVLYGTLGQNLQKLQLVQNSLARTVCKVWWSENITPILVHLHWLPVQNHIQYNIALITFCAHHSQDANNTTTQIPGRHHPTAGAFSTTEVERC